MFSMSERTRFGVKKTAAPKSMHTMKVSALNKHPKPSYPDALIGTTKSTTTRNWRTTTSEPAKSTGRIRPLNFMPVANKQNQETLNSLVEELLCEIRELREQIANRKKKSK
jgi:hypothetical protein